MASNIERTRQRVQSMLKEIASFDVDSDGDFTFRHESTQVFVKVSSFLEDHTAVEIWAITNVEVPPSPELFRYIALNNHWMFGALRASEEESGVSVLFAHSLLGDFLDQAEFERAIVAVAVTADEVDDKIKYLFGGRVFHD